MSQPNQSKQQPKSRRKRRSLFSCLFSPCFGDGIEQDGDDKQNHHQSSISDEEKKDKQQSLGLIPKDTLQEVQDQIKNQRIEPTSTGHSSRDRCNDNRDDEDEESTRIRQEEVFASRNYHTQESKPSTIDEVQCRSSTENENEDNEISLTPTSSTSEEHVMQDQGGIIDAPKPKNIDNDKEKIQPLLPKQKPEEIGKKCLVLDLDETLVHSSFKSIPDADFIIPVDIDNIIYNVYVIKRPGVEEFLNQVGKIYEVVIFTASVSKYGNPLLDQLDSKNIINHRLFRESCSNYQGNYIKDLSLLGRPLKDIIIIDNSPPSYILQPQHAIPISSWFSDVHDNELLDMLPILEDLSKNNLVSDVSLVLDVSLS